MASRMHYRKVRVFGKSDGGSAFKQFWPDIAKSGARGTPSSSPWLFVFACDFERGNLPGPSPPRVEERPFSAASAALEKWALAPALSRRNLSHWLCNHRNPVPIRH